MTYTRVNMFICILVKSATAADLRRKTCPSPVSSICSYAWFRL